MVKFNMCDHLNQIIDQHEGSIVCGDCALVLDVYFSQQEHSSQKISVSLQPVDHLKSYLLDCCDRMHIPTLISENIYKKFIQFRTGHDFERISDMQLMAYSIYITLKNDGIGRNIEYVAQNTGISSKLLWKCESLDPYISMPINIENVLAPVYSMFNLSSEDCKIIVKISKHFQERHFSPLTLSSTLVYVYCRISKIQISIKKVCSIFCVSSMSIYRCKSYITYDKFQCILENILNDK